MRISTLAAGAAVAALTLAACAKRPVPLGPLPAPVVTNDSLDRMNRARADSIARADSLRRADAARAQAARAQAEQDSLRLIREREQRGAALSADVLSVLAASIYFDYDQSMLTEAAHAILNAKIPILQARPTLHIRIIGHTDQRGAAEYNLALGLRRAAETKAYLVANGADAARIEIFSLGAERPAVEGSGENVWSKNRRAEFQPLPGGVEQ